MLDKVEAFIAFVRAYPLWIQIFVPFWFAVLASVLIVFKPVTPAASQPGIEVPPAPPLPNHPTPELTTEPAVVQTAPVLVTADREFTSGITQPFDSNSDLSINRLSVSVTARPGGRGARYKWAKLMLDIPGIPAEQKVQIVADVTIDGAGGGCASLKDSSTNEILFEECTESKNIILSLRNKVSYAVEVNGSVNAEDGNTVSRRTSVEFSTKK